jgi:Flp pilus assembly protein TadD
MQSENRTREADHAWQVAFTCEPTNPELLLAHAATLREAGETERADELLRRIVSGKWQPRFDEVRKNAQRQLKR